MAHVHDPDGGNQMNYDYLDPKVVEQGLNDLFSEPARLVVTEESNPAFLLQSLSSGVTLAVMGPHGVRIGTFIPASGPGENFLTI